MLMTKELAKILPKLGETDGEDNPKVIAHLFHPLSNWDWYVTEGEQDEDGNWTFFGLVDGLFKEWGYFTSQELESVKVLGLGVERDILWQIKGVKDI